MPSSKMLSAHWKTSHFPETSCVTPTNKPLRSERSQLNAGTCCSHATKGRNMMMESPLTVQFSQLKGGCSFRTCFFSVLTAFFMNEKVILCHLLLYWQQLCDTCALNFAVVWDGGVCFVSKHIWKHQPHGFSYRMCVFTTSSWAKDVLICWVHVSFEIGEKLKHSG